MRLTRNKMKVNGVKHETELKKNTCCLNDYTKDWSRKGKGHLDLVYDTVKITWIVCSKTSSLCAYRLIDVGFLMKGAKREKGRCP